MFGIIATVCDLVARTPLAMRKVRTKRSLKTSINRLEAEMHTLLSSNPGKTGRMLVALFNLDLRNSRQCLARGDFRRAIMFREEARKTRTLVRNTIEGRPLRRRSIRYH